MAREGERGKRNRPKIGDMGVQIQHRGIVERVEDDKVIVSVARESACAGCHAKGICGVDGQKRLIEVRTKYASTFKPEERVVVALLSKRMGFGSVALGYVIPLIVMLAILFGAKALGYSDGIAAIATLAGIALYYVVLYVIRHTIERNIQFTIIKE